MTNSKRETILSLLRLEGVASHAMSIPALEVAAGECVCISGPSGAGKSLLLRAIADLDPHDGRVWLDGREAREYRPWDWRRLVGLLPAESQWWRERVGEHFAEVDEAQWRALGLGRETLDWQVARCSTGERQRLALLRLLANQPRVLLLDEPTAALDPASVQRVEALVAAYREQRQAAVLWVSHDPAQMQRVASRQIRIVAGRLEEAA
ncbi:ABC transporter ATP-binding protein [Sulfurivermis fontis]|uniref:ABC transporter ATP-binding protein n=1 Tax=Sulfurivermis fontis TaxID=1972068 RepID=UPI001558995B|nr:ATP-binding cassette domain-containing protein [Sulfurivermis fontis]